MLQFIKHNACGLAAQRHIFPHAEHLRNFTVDALGIGLL
jgi:hypothetical protein